MILADGVADDYDRKARVRIERRLTKGGSSRCWHVSGAAVMNYHGQTINVARFMWSWHNRAPLLTAQRVRQTCGNAACCAPSHLEATR